MTEPVIVAIPPKGGTLLAVLNRLIEAGWIHGALVTGIKDLIQRDKDRIKLEERIIRAWEEHAGDVADVRARVMAYGYDDADVTAAIERMRRYTDDDGGSCITFTPKMGVDGLLRALRDDPDPTIREAAHTIHLELDLSRYGRPSRMMFDHLEFEWQPVEGTLIHGVLVGTDHEVTPTYLRRHKRDLSLSCYDAFHNTLLDALDTGKVHNWSELMDHLIEANTDVRILGSVGLDDYLGHFVLMPEGKAKRVQELQTSRVWNDGEQDAKMAILAEEPILIDANYEGIYRMLLDADKYGLEFEHTTRDIEEACVRENRTAIYIVQSGGTIARTPGLCVVGEELLTSETILAVNEERLDHHSGVEQLVTSIGASDEDASDKWRQAMAERLGGKLI